MGPFLVFATLPGAHNQALFLGRKDPQHYLNLLEEKGEDVPKVLKFALQADLNLALGDEEAARKNFGEIAVIVSSEEGSWEQGRVPKNQYLAEEPPVTEQSQMQFLDARRGHPELAGGGAGSHRDNWFIRRAVAFNEMDLAEREYRRVWGIHQRYAAAHLVTLTYASEKGEGTKERRLVPAGGLDGVGLQFALDFAFFLLRAEKDDEAFGILREAFLTLDMDQDPNQRGSVQVSEEEMEGVSELSLRGMKLPYSSAGSFSKRVYPFGLRSLCGIQAD